MARTVTAKDLKNKTGDVLRAVADGERVVVTRHGKPFAVVVPYEPAAAATDFDRAWADIDAALAASEPEFPTWQEATAHGRGRSR